MSISPSSPPPLSRPPRWHIVWPAAVLLMTFIASGESEVAAPSFVPSVDKLAHFSIYGLLATLVVRMILNEDRPARAVWLAVAGVSLYGISDEYRQSFTPGRSVEFVDWIADTAGAAVAAVAYGYWAGWRRWLERPIFGRTSGVAPAAPSVDASSAR